MQRQTDDLILSTYIICSGEILKVEEESMNNFPFVEDFTGKKVAVYGAGTFGQQLVRRQKSEDHCDIVT